MRSAPEIIQHYHTGMGYGREVDMWSLGVILYIMYVLTHPCKCSDRCANAIPRPLYMRCSLYSSGSVTVSAYVNITLHLHFTIRAYRDPRLSGIAPFGQGQQAKQLLTDIIQVSKILIFGHARSIRIRTYTSICVTVNTDQLTSARHICNNGLILPVLKCFLIPPCSAS